MKIDMFLAEKDICKKVNSLRIKADKMPKINFAKIEHLDSIIRIWGLNRATLGLMPKDAFIQAIKKKWVLVSVIDNFVVGYLQFRYTAKNQTISIVHLCVDKTMRGKGVAEKLVDKLVEEFHSKARGIRLNCRSDYVNAIKFWTKYNFQPKGNLPSRGNNTNVHLITWWYSFGNKDLFSLISNDKLKAVLDFNIIAKLRDLTTLDDAKLEIAQLQADWLVAEVEYHLASETISELFRDQNADRKEQTKLFLKQFPELNIDKSLVKTLEKELENILQGNTVNDRSDRRQIAESILSGFSYFITLDGPILKKSKTIYDSYQLKVVTPSSFISEIDLSINAEDYNPSKLSAKNFTIAKLKPDERKKIEEIFLSHATGEKKSALNTTIGNIISTPSGYVSTIKDGSDPVGIFGYYEADNSLVVSLIRTKQYSLRQTIFIQNVNDLINIGLGKQKNFLFITDEHLTDIEKNILQRFGFFKNKSQFVRGIKQGILTNDELETSLENITNEIPQLKELVSAICEKPTSESYLNCVSLEKILWPVKLKDAEIPCFIVPIKPYYAKALFDTKAAKMELFGSEPTLIWSKENVYYRNIIPNVEKFPARILWYASADKISPRQKSIVASSTLDEVIVGPANELYKKHEKFGIYSWDRDIKPLVRGVATKCIKILKFSDSEPFNNVIPLSRLKKILCENNESDNNFQSPLKIKTSTFIQIYTLGIGLRDDHG